jgi:hypothetical protein
LILSIIHFFVDIGDRKYYCAFSWAEADSESSSELSSLSDSSEDSSSSSSLPTVFLPFQETPDCGAGAAEADPEFPDAEFVPAVADLPLLLVRYKKALIVKVLPRFSHTINPKWTIDWPTGNAKNLVIVRKPNTNNMIKVKALSKNRREIFRMTSFLDLSEGDRVKNRNTSAYT